MKAYRAEAILLTYFRRDKFAFFERRQTIQQIFVDCSSPCLVQRKDKPLFKKERNFHIVLNIQRSTSLFT